MFRRRDPNSADSEAMVSLPSRLPRMVEQTPAFLYDLSVVRRKMELLAGVRRACGLKVLYSIKASPLSSILDIAKDHVDGLAASSLFEARWAAEALAGSGSVHVTTPGLRKGEIKALASASDFVSFNSLEQYRRLAPLVGERVNVGLRINPGRSFLSDHRYDPCRPGSKLGVPISEARAFLAGSKGAIKRISGLHFHNQHSARNFASLRQTLGILVRELGEFLPRLRWLNIGGGYLFDTAEDLEELRACVTELQDSWKLEVYFEPGKGVIGEAGSLVASVIDLFVRDGKTVGILDTTVNHHPEVFEYQTRPEIDGEFGAGGHCAVLAGCTCLSGDIFGEYEFSKPLAIGDRVVFKNVGAYSLIKAHRFNGYNLPDIYVIDETGPARLVKGYGYDDFRRQWCAEESG